MKTLVYSFTQRQQQGFTVYVLNNGGIELAAVPELGAKIISVKDLRTGREWMWHPPGGLRLFRNHPGDDFSQSPLAGTDECLPTIAPCTWQDRELPDHGEVWSVPWKVDDQAWQSGILKTTTKLAISPFEFERSIELADNEIQINYQLTNRGSMPESFLWALHPLLKLQPGDRLEMPASTRALLDSKAWGDAVASAIPENACAKVFAAPISEGVIAISNEDAVNRLEFGWNPAKNDTLGFWLSRGGWHGHDQFALEPANGDADALTEAAGRNRCGVVAASGVTTWQMRLRVGL